VTLCGVTIENDASFFGALDLSVRPIKGGFRSNKYDVMEERCPDVVE
jgi:hypothetical protein